MVLLALCLLVRGGSILWNWERLSQRLEAHARAFTLLDPGSRVLPVVLLPEASIAWPESHFVCWSVPSRGCFVPILFSRPDQHTLRLEPPYAACDRGYADAYLGESFTVEASSVRDCYDFVWLYNPAGKTVELPPCCEAIFTAQGLTLYRVLSP
jgi:hypothetical protein